MRRNFFRTAAMVLLCIATVCSCGKDGADGKDGKDGAQGAQGPAGPAGQNGADGQDGTDGQDGATGPQGPAGPQGPQGIAGNAGVMMYQWGSRTFTTFTSYHSIPLTREAARKSLIYAYYANWSSLSAWYPVPGVSTPSTYQVINYLEEDDYENWVCGIMLHNYPAGGNYVTPVTWYGFRVIIVPIPNGNITQMSVKPSIDYGNYAEVAAYYGLPE
jgi:hypothetical protein